MESTLTTVSENVTFYGCNKCDRNRGRYWQVHLHYHCLCVIVCVFVFLNATHLITLWEAFILIRTSVLQKKAQGSSFERHPAQGHGQRRVQSHSSRMDKGLSSLPPQAWQFAMTASQSASEWCHLFAYTLGAPSFAVRRSPWRRHAPLLSVAEVAHVTGMVTGGTERSHVTLGPWIVGKAILGAAIVAV